MWLLSKYDSPPSSKPFFAPGTQTWVLAAGFCSAPFLSSGMVAIRRSASATVFAVHVSVVRSNSCFASSGHTFSAAVSFASTCISVGSWKPWKSSNVLLVVGHSDTYVPRGTMSGSSSSFTYSETSAPVRKDFEKSITRRMSSVPRVSTLVRHGA